MVANPMQRKARNSFLLGALITLIICLIIFGLFYFLVINKEKKQSKQEGEKVIAYVLSQNVESGDVVTSDLLMPIEVYETMIPSNYINSVQLSNLTLQDERGNMLFTDSEGNLYINKEDNMEYKTTGEKDKKNRVLIQEDLEGFYRTKITGEKEYIEFLSVPKVAKIDMYANSIVTLDSLASSDDLVTDDKRYIEYNMLSLPTTIMVGDYIDIRLTLPSGQDLIVVSKKEVQSVLGDTIGLQLTEEEILMMESAIVEAYIMTASKLYAIQYLEPGMQNAATKTYTPTEAVRGLIERNPNIKAEAKAQLVSRFNGDIRAWTNLDKSAYAANSQANLEQGLQEEIENAKRAREAYLSGLTSY